MKLVVGLGNIGKEYASTRHNIGFIVIDEFASELMLTWRNNPDWVANYIKTDDFVLLKPGTFMNKSGVSVAAASRFYKIEKKDILIIHDELDLPYGKIRLSFDSISAGHNGVESVIKGLGGVDFARLRIGIGKPKTGSAEKYVLQRFTDSERKKHKEIINISKEAIKSYMADGVEATMNRFN